MIASPLPATNRRSAVALVVWLTTGSLIGGCAGTEPLGPRDATGASATTGTGRDDAGPGTAAVATAPPPDATTPATGPASTPTTPGLTVDEHPGTTLRPAATTTTAPPPLAPLVRPSPVTTVVMTFTDTARPAGAAPSRTLRTTIRYPEGEGPFPLVVFAHGWAVAAGDYAALLDAVAAAGYVVAAPDFPLTSSANGAVDEMDTFNQPYDLSFLVSRLQGVENRQGPLAGRVWTGPVGAMGQSDGAMTVMGMGLNSCCLDTRLGGIVALSGKVTGWANGWFPEGSKRVLAVHGSADGVNPIANGRNLFAQAPPGSALLTVEGGDHLGIFTSGAAVAPIAGAAIAFFDETLRADPSGRAALIVAGAQPGFHLETR